MRLEASAVTSQRHAIGKTFMGTYHGNLTWELHILHNYPDYPCYLTLNLFVKKVVKSFFLNMGLKINTTLMSQNPRRIVDPDPWRRQLFAEVEQNSPFGVAGPSMFLHFRWLMNEEYGIYK